MKPTTLMWLNLRDDIFKGGRKLTVGRLNLIERANRELSAEDDQKMKRRRGGIVDQVSRGQAPAPLPAKCRQTPHLCSW